MNDPIGDLVGEYEVTFNREILLTFCQADFNALAGSKFESIRYAPLLENIMSMAKTVASNSYHIERQVEQHIPATFWDWVKSALPTALQRGPFTVTTVPVGYSITVRHMCPHLGNDRQACAEFLDKPGHMHGEQSAGSAVGRWLKKEQTHE